MHGLPNTGCGKALTALAQPRDAGELVHFLQLSSETVLEFANGLVGHFHEVCRPGHGMSLGYERQSKGKHQHPTMSRA